MTDKEKLTEFLITADDCQEDICRNACRICLYERESDCVYKLKADHLIANGVTIQKHGKWEMISHSEVDQCADYACSVCSGVLIDVIDDPEHGLNAYCPMCGAKMDGD